MQKLIFTLLLILVGLPIQTRAQEQPQPAEQPSAPQTAERQEFDQQLKLYKENLKKLREMKEKYQTSTPDEKDAIYAEYAPLIQSTEKIQLALIPIAEKAFIASNGQDEDLRNFLYAMLHWQATRENYEVAYDIAKTVFKYPAPEKNLILHALAAYSAFCVMELDDAQAWYDIAKEDPKMLRDFETNQEVPVSYSIMNLLPKYRKLWEDEKAAREKDATKNLPQVLLHTNKGDIVLELFKDEAPNAVGNFLTLVQQGYYTDCPFHRVLPHFMAQGGDPTGTGTGGPGYCIPCECDKPDARMHFRGSISMAHAGRDTGGSQFFLTFVPTDHLNGVHTVFGRVVQGMEVLADLQRIDPESETQPAPDKILEARIIRGEPFEFKKLPSNR